MFLYIFHLKVKDLIKINLVALICMFVYCGADFNDLNFKFYRNILFGCVIAPVSIVYGSRLHVFTGANTMLLRTKKLKESIFYSFGIPTFIISLIILVRLLITRDFENSFCIFGLDILYACMKGVEILYDKDHKGF